jgi:hypothetical protein
MLAIMIMAVIAKFLFDSLTGIAAKGVREINGIGLGLTLTG